jgi:predicted metal-dependent phosphoesterase TrpH
MSDFRADLHTHSSCSDGSLSPQELIERARQVGLGGLSITDHDTVDAYLQVEDQLGTFVVPGVEFSCLHQGQNVHILAYSFNPKNEELQAFCEEHRKRRCLRACKMIERLRQKKIFLDEEKILKEKNVGRPHIAQELVEKGIVSSFSEAFSRFLGDGKACYVPSEAPSVKETIAFIRSLKGVPVLAHPHLITHLSLLRSLYNLPFEGIETRYAKISAEKEKAFVEVAKEKRWIETGGSDFHGEAKPQIPLGSSWTSQKTFTFLLDRYHGNI